MQTAVAGKRYTTLSRNKNMESAQSFSEMHNQTPDQASPVVIPNKNLTFSERLPEFWLFVEDGEAESVELNEYVSITSGASVGWQLFHLLQAASVPRP